MNEILTIDGEQFTFIKRKTYLPISVYRGENSYLRIGAPEFIRKDIAAHKQFLELGFPYPAIIKEGVRGGDMYYIEESFGERHFGEIFRSDIAENGAISAEHFNQFLKLGERFLEAQFRSKRSTASKEEFWAGIHFDNVLSELPELKNELNKAFEKSWQKISALPAVLTHGDFNAFNQFKNGVIDVDSEYSFWGPAGYDIVSCVVQPSFFPKEGNYEYIRAYDFSTEQTEEYLAMADRIFEAAKLPALSMFVPDFRFCRSVWSVVRMETVPKLQKWRYDLFKKTTREYLEN